MTYRLIALMSLVLLLCLATFAVMAEHYHDEVMGELQHTVALVGQETFRSLDPVTEHFPGARHVRELRAAEIEESPEVEVRETDVRVTVRRFPPDPETAGQAMVFVTKRQTNGEEQTETVRCVNDDCLLWTSEDGELTDTHFIRIDAIRAERDSETGMVLRIPKFRTVAAGTMPVEPSPGTAGPGVTGSEASAGIVVDLEPAAIAVREDGGDRGPIPAVFDEDIVLPIPTRDYQAMFSTFRKKWIVLFAGVFAVGLLLTSGLASRFTRPIRRLDAGIRRLSDGDLDVEVPVRGSDEIARLGRTFNEMTRRLRASRERSRELTRREKLSALGRLAAGVAHDVRNPLHSIGLTLQHLQETNRPDDDDRARDFDRSLAIIREEIRRLDGLVGNFLRFARSDERERRAVDLRELLRETTRLVGKEAEWRKVAVDLEIEDDVPIIEADAEAIRSSILNLVLNSFEAMPDGGELKLRLSRADGDAVLQVSDTGIGIPSSDQDRVFEFAYSTRQEGNGLGLAMVHQCVVEEHGGRVSLESREGQGTRVTLTFPAVRNDGVGDRS